MSRNFYYISRAYLIEVSVFDMLKFVLISLHISIIRQANIASTLLQKLMNEDKTIVTCNEQLLEIISAVEKIKMKEYNRLAKANGIARCNNIKDFRTREDFASAKSLCNTVISDVKHFADVHHCTYSVDQILSKIDLADINDCIYYDYCKEKGIEFYTFDMDIEKLGMLGNVHVLR